MFDEPTIEFSYKNDDLGDPLINSYHALALKLATKEEIETIKALAFQVDDVLKAYFLGLGIELVDFKLEFGRLSDGTIVLADEISPDTCRLWDCKTHEKLDKDRFRASKGGPIWEDFLEQSPGGTACSIFSLAPTITLTWAPAGAVW